MPDDCDRLLRLLVREGQAGDSLAIRTVLQLMLGAAVKMGLRGYRRAISDDGEAVHVAVAAMWELIARYNLATRTGRVATNLTMDLLHRLTQDARKGHIVWENEVLAPPSVEDVDVEFRMLERRASDLAGCSSHAEVVDTLAWGVDTKAITPSDAALLLRVYAPLPGQAGGRVVAQELGLSWAAVRQRCSRAVRRLADAAAAHVAAQDSLPL